PTNPWIYPLLEDVLISLCHCNILGVGDMNVRNTLVNPKTQQFYIIDFDDNLTKDRDDEVFYFNKPPGKKLSWYDNVAIHYNSVADRLTPLLTDEIVLKNNLLPRVERAINLLQRHAKTSVPQKMLTLNIVNTNLGHMTWKGLFGGASKTFSNIDFDIAKSVLQIYIRRVIVLIEV